MALKAKNIYCLVLERKNFITPRVYLVTQGPSSYSRKNSCFLSLVIMKCTQESWMVFGAKAVVC